MKKQYSHCKGFSEWYCTYEIQMSADPELRFLNCARAENVHKEYTQIGATRGTSLAIDVILVREGESRPEQGKEVERAADAPSGQAVLRRFFPGFRDQEAMEFCEKQLGKLNKLVEECEHRFR